MSKRLDLTGQTFGRLTVISYAGADSNGRSLFLCSCECGNEKIVKAHNLKRGNTRSCGCITKEINKERAFKHGISRRKIYHVWQGMRQRCHNPDSNLYKYYGGRGIEVSSEWENFQSFYTWAISCGYKEGLSLDRIDVNGNYCPENCRWATMAEQGNNRRNNHKITYRGKTLTLTEWSKETGIRVETLRRRLKKGLSLDEVFLKKAR